MKSSNPVGYVLKLKIAVVIATMLTATTVWSVEFEDYDFSQWSQEVTECDILTSHGRDPGHVADPITSSTMDKPAAIIACEAAVAADPENPRLNYQLGRAYGYSNRGEEAMPYRLKALEGDYPQSLFVIGYLYFIGRTIEQDTCKAYELWQRGAHYKRLAALVSLPRHYMRGDFADCEGTLSKDDLRAYLQQAIAESGGDYYVGMLVADLLTELEGFEGQ
jgi:tetratricopeptide (TPR) repeat protein